MALVNRVQAIDHLYGRFFSVTDTLGTIALRGSTPPAPEFTRLRSLGRRPRVSIPWWPRMPGCRRTTRWSSGSPLSGLPFVSEQLMRLDSIYFNPVEWEGTMPGMNWATTGTDTRWILRDPATGQENMDIHWRFRRGSLSRIRLIGARNTLHGMQHPIHLHGQRFLVLAVNGKQNQNPVWKDTVLVPAGGVGRHSGRHVQPRAAGCCTAISRNTCNPK